MKHERSVGVDGFELDGLLHVRLLVLERVIFDRLDLDLVAFEMILGVEVLVFVVAVDGLHVLPHLVDATQDPVADLASRQAFVD